MKKPAPSRQGIGFTSLNSQQQQQQQQQEFTHTNIAFKSPQLQTIKTTTTAASSTSAAAGVRDRETTPLMTSHITSNKADESDGIDDDDGTRSPHVLIIGRIIDRDQPGFLL
jgi:hypothetical protein